MAVRANRTAPSKGERAILSLLTEHPRLTGPQIASWMDCSPGSVKVMIHNLRTLGYNIVNGQRGPKSVGYRLLVSGRGIAPDEREAILADLKRWPLMSHTVIAKKYNRSPITIQRLGRAWGLGRHGK